MCGVIKQNTTLQKIDTKVVIEALDLKNNSIDFIVKDY